MTQITRSEDSSEDIKHIAAAKRELETYIEFAQETQEIIEGVGLENDYKKFLNLSAHEKTEIILKRADELKAEAYQEWYEYDGDPAAEWSMGSDIPHRPHCSPKQGKSPYIAALEAAAKEAIADIEAM